MRDLEGCRTVSDELLHVILKHVANGLDKRDNQLAAGLVRDPDDVRNLAPCGCLCDQLFDLHGRHVDSTSLDDVLQPGVKPQSPIGVQTT